MNIFNIAFSILPFYNSNQKNRDEFDPNFYFFRLFQANSSVTIVVKCPKYDCNLNFLSFHFSSKALKFSLHDIYDKAIFISPNIFNITVYPPLSGEYDVYAVFGGNETLFNSHFEITNPLERKTNSTSIQCIGDSYLTRWCHFENVCFDGNQIIVFSPYELKFEKIFLIAGARSPPFDDEKHRIRSSDIKIFDNISEYQFDETPLHVTSPFFNDMMLWHNLMDFVIPTYWTMTSNYANLKTEAFGKHGNGYGHINSSNRILIYDLSQTFSRADFITLLSDNELLFSSRLTSPQCYKTAYIGLRKTEKSPTIDRPNRNSLTVKYEIDSYISKYFHNYIINKVTKGKPSKCLPSSNKPFIVLLERKTQNEKRRLINQDEVFEATKELCPFCEIYKTDLSHMSIREQILLLCKASLIIGVHGSGLVHGLWLMQSNKQHPTGIVEFLPYKYTCRDWYHQMAKFAKIRYYSIRTLRLNQSRWDPHHNMTKVKRCQNEPGECERIRCHDFLRDQSIIADIDQYKEVVGSFFRLLEQTKKNNQKDL